MADGDKIILFKFIQKCYQDVGIYPSQSNQNHNTINSKIGGFHFFSFAQFFISTIAYALFEANSAIEYGLAFFICPSIVFYCSLYLISLWQIKSISNFIENCERFIEKSEYS